MAITVGAMLASSKLLVTQGDLHLLGSSIDQLIVQFDQMAFDEYLAAEQIKAGKSHGSKEHAAASRSTASSSSAVSAPLPDDRSIRAPTRPRLPLNKGKGD